MRIIFCWRAAPQCKAQTCCGNIWRKLTTFQGESDDGVLGDGVQSSGGALRKRTSSKLDSRKCGPRLGTLLYQQSVWAAVYRNHATAAYACGENSRKGPVAIQQTKGKEALVHGKESQNRRTTDMVLFCPAHGREIILFVSFFYEIPLCPVIPMWLSSTRLGELDTEIGGTAAGGRPWKNSCSSMVW